MNDLQSNLLNYICNSYVNQKDCRVMELIYLSEIGSPATLHKNLKVLVSVELIEIYPDKNDFRVKKIIPTKLALKRLDELDILLN
jgi:hypothetical protein